MSNAKLGEKRDCASCGIKFYDFNKTTPTCPKCGTVYVAPKENAKARKVAPVKAAAKVAKKPVKKIEAPVDEEGLDLEAFSDIEVEGEDDAIEDIEDIEEDVENLSELEAREMGDDRVNTDDADDDLLIDEMGGGETLVDAVEDEESDEDEEDE